MNPGCWTSRHSPKHESAAALFKRRRAVTCRHGWGMQAALVRHLVGNPAGPYLIRKYIGDRRCPCDAGIQAPS